MNHLIGHVEGVWVSKASHLEVIMNQIAERCEFTVVGRSFHQFEPHGAIGVLVLLEGHFNARTFPELNKIYICCSPEFNTGIIEEEFSAPKGTWQVVGR